MCAYSTHSSPSNLNINTTYSKEFLCYKHILFIMVPPFSDLCNFISIQDHLKVSIHFSFTYNIYHDDKGTDNCHSLWFLMKFHIYTKVQQQFKHYFHKTQSNKGQYQDHGEQFHTIGYDLDGGCSGLMTLLHTVKITLKHSPQASLGNKVIKKNTSQDQLPGNGTKTH